jgi:uncharacterized delta-60 repeat protein
MQTCSSKVSSMGWLARQLRVMVPMGVILCMAGLPGYGQTLDTFNPTPAGSVSGLAIQNDGKVLLGGYFTALAGQTQSHIARLNSDGTVDASFGPEADGTVDSLSVQTDGKIVLGGRFTKLCGQTRIGIGRLNRDATLDAQFNPGAYLSSPIVFATGVQTDSKLVVGGFFTVLNGAGQTNVTRINADGSVDTTFVATTDNGLYCLATQPDGKVVIGGYFKKVNGSSRVGIARLNADGTVDTAFRVPNLVYHDTYGAVEAMALQSDGKVIIGGHFDFLDGVARARLARLNADGSLDSSFTAGVTDLPNVFNLNYALVSSVAVQSDGKVLVGGAFTTAGGIARTNLARFNSNGVVDTTFAANADSWVFALGVQADGKVLVGGGFSSLMNTPCGTLARLNNTSAATQSLVLDGANLNWQWNGPGPNFWRTSFEASSNGTDWFSLGAGTRVPSGWELSGVAATTGMTLRARGFVSGGYFGGSTWFVESARGPAAINLQPEDRTNNAGSSERFIAQATGTSPLSYQWLQNGVLLRDGGKVSGTTSSTLTISNLTGNDAAGYSLIVSNAAGGVTSRVAALCVIDPFIVTQPLSQSADAGRTLRLITSVAGAQPLAYQWRKDGTNLPGATADFLTLPAVQWSDRGGYDVVARNGFGVATSIVAVISVNVAPADWLNAGANGLIKCLTSESGG